MFNAIDPEKKIMLGVSEEEKQMLDAIRSLGWGTVEAQIRDGKFIRIVKSESLLTIKNGQTIDKA